MKDLQFQVGDLLMVHLNKERLHKGMPYKLKMRILGLFTILATYGNNAYKVELPRALILSPIFSVVDLV